MGALDPLCIHATLLIAGMYKLTNGSNYMEGIAWVLHDGEWGTICSDDFKINAAKVFCKSIGLVYDTISGSM